MAMRSVDGESMDLRHGLQKATQTYLPKRDLHTGRINIALGKQNQAFMICCVFCACLFSASHW